MAYVEEVTFWQWLRLAATKAGRRRLRNRAIAKRINRLYPK